MIKWLQNYFISWGQTEIQADIIARALFCLVMLLAVWMVYLVLKGPVLRLLERFVVETTTKIKWDDLLMQMHFFHRIIRFLPVLLLYLGIPLVFRGTQFETTARSILAMLLVILGMFIEPVSIVMVTIPIFMPIVIAMGWDPVWFGAIMVLNLEMATISPPFGLSLFVMKGIASPDTTMGDIYRAAIPFVGLNLIVMAAMIAFPDIVLWLPGLMD